MGGGRGRKRRGERKGKREGEEKKERGEERFLFQDSDRRTVEHNVTHECDKCLRMHLEKRQSFMRGKKGEALSSLNAKVLM
jgi:hypothetical protein